MVDMLTAHASLETASGDKMYNYNFAGIKGHSPAGVTARCRTREVLGGKEVVIRDGFRAYGTIEEGARDYVRTMKAQFSGALAPAARGDVGGFANALKRAHYYTASEADYARGLTNVMNAPGAQASSRASTGSSSSFNFAATDLGLSSSGLSRVSDALDAERWLGAMPSSYASSSSSSSRVSSASDDDDDS
jgi:flagellum-specific peptidoglycan hydrolase FlgJ